MNITLEFDTDEIENLCNCSMANFIWQKPGRFYKHSADDGFDSEGRGMLHFFDRFLELKIYQTVMKAEGHKTAIYSDEGNDHTSWVLVVYKQRSKK